MSERSNKSAPFADRLRQACDQHPECPRLNDGRLTWLRHELGKRGLFVSLETIRKWSSGEATPRQDKIEALAQVLAVDPTWLFMGPLSQFLGVHPAPTFSTTIPIRPNVTISISGVPWDLTPVEAKRLANIIVAHASVEE